MQDNLEPEKQYIIKDVMKKRKRDQEAIETKLKAKDALRKNRPKKQVVRLPEKFVKRYRAAQKSFADLKRRTIKTMENEPAVEKERTLLVIRIRGVHDISNVQKRILYNMNLREVNTAIFMKMNKKNLMKLKRIENYITYGFPTRKTIQELVYKKLCINLGGERKLINTNQLVQQNIGGDVICLEDVIKSINNLDSNFDKIVSAIWPFKLTTGADVVQSHIRKPFSQGGEWGFREDLINEFVSKMI